MNRLDAVAAALGLPHDVASADIVDATHDSRAVEPGWLFCCVRGARVDGHRFAPDAVSAGAAALLVDHRLDLDVPQLVVPDVRAAMGPAAAAVHGHPSDRLTVVGVTGTNGKSSVVQLLADVWGRAGERTEIFGTLTGSRTTPEGPDLQRSLRQAHDRGIRMVAMEVSSHALQLHRVAGVHFAAAVFTNLGRDHLDFHHDQASYFEAKARLFEPTMTPIAVVNSDDWHGARLLERVAATGGIEAVAFGLADAEGLTVDGPISRFRWRGHEVVLHLAGHHNVANALAAAATGAALGLDPADIADALCATEPVRGRFELVDVGQPFTVAVDYAHTPDALAAVLAAARQVARGRVVLVFGCGGDRDHDKRPEMGAVAQRQADLVVVTSDNPRGEDPAAIIAAVVGGMEPCPSTKLTVEPDRRRAIAVALAAARADDVVVIAGKGHETVQVIGDLELPFDDRQVVVEELGARA